MRATMMGMAPPPGPPPGAPPPAGGPPDGGGRFDQPSAGRTLVMLSLGPPQRRRTLPTARSNNAP
jgi:hypothetical protein